MSPLKIGVIGAGNIGTAMAALLCRAGAEVELTARGARLDTISAEGIALDDRGTVITARPACGRALSDVKDAVFVCVKAQSLPEAIAANAAGIGPETLVIPMVNGMPFWFFAKGGDMGNVPYLDPRDSLAETLTPAQVLGAVLLMTVRMDETGQALSSNTPTLSLGPVVAEGTDMSKVEALIATLEAGGVRTDLCADIRQKVLVKLIANVATNPLSALTGATLAQIGREDSQRFVALYLAGEFRDWAAKHGYDLPSDDWLTALFLDAGEFPTSMLQDARAGRPLELDAICRAPLDLARRDGGDMPLMARLLAEIETSPSLPRPASDVAGALDRLQTVNAYLKG